MLGIPKYCPLPSALCLLALLTGARAAEPAPLDKAGAEKLFTLKVLPLLKARCYGCHGEKADDLKGELHVLSREALLKGGESGDPSIIPGQPAQSVLIKAIRWEELEMPPKENDRLNETEIAWFASWIAAGAPWPDEQRQQAIRVAERSVRENAAGLIVKTSGGLSDDWTYRRYQRGDLWAYQPVKQPPVPRIAGATHPIDAFLRARQAQHQLAPAAAADKRTWLRRAAFDLTGLPPSPEAVDAFAGDDAPEARTRAIDRLLASSQYGERMAQHWLDVARYSDTSGFSNDYERPHAWRYRDYVIRSFNADKPYNRFVLEQIAGDELEPDNPELRIAVGFLRMGPWEHTAMSVAAVTRQLFLDDITNQVGETFLAQALRCCKCHDHKFDPLPTRDYYSVQAVFATTQFAEAKTPFLPEENTAGFEQRKARLEAIWKDKDWVQTDDDKNDSLRRITKKRDDYLKLAVKRFDAASFSVQNKGQQPVSILIGGSLEAPAAEVSPGALSVLGDTCGEALPSQIPAEKTGRRLALARWIADADNPLTARVIVNRVWQMHFGRGLVASSNNFGKTGARPTHPELLDWLAHWFVENGWSIKKLHRLIMTSDAYRQSGRHPEPEQVAEADPNNELLTYFPPRRLTAEELRDTMLAVTGELSTELGGPGIYPEINWEVALQPRHIMGSIAPSYIPSLNRADRHRRTIYAFKTRTLADPMLEVFNRPGDEVSCERRDETTVTPQVFALFNGQNTHSRALALARRLEQTSDEQDKQLDAAFRLVFGRLPREAERKLCLAHLARMTEHHRKHPPVQREFPTSVPREMIDEQTGLPFAWIEKLHGMDQYEADLQAADVGPKTRALAEVCLVLLNSNEFLYVY